ncbi:Grx4 family monothiol glutaredoxin [Myxococcota bacterium]|nr:Grx4 family monothiol glutaredoxin [Myxococcota bacterium]
MELHEDTRKRISQIVESSRVVLFMKGDRTQPRCGFSAAVVGVLDEIGVEYETVDVLADQEIREGVKGFSNWPTLPQLYVGGTFVGGSDIVRQLHGSGELNEMLGVPVVPVSAPGISITDAARDELARAVASAGGEAVRLVVDARFQVGLELDTPRPGDFEVQANGVKLLVDRGSARRADGIAIDFRTSPMGRGFVIDNPNRIQVRSITPAELKERMDRGDTPRILDVRGADERAIARIEGSRLLDAAEAREVEGLPKDAFLVFVCHTGVRSQDAAERFASRGFRNTYNLTGGIDAWSREVDPSVPRY